MSKTIAKKFEVTLGKFIWKGSGWLLRVALEEIKNFKNKGGLDLKCI